jgi:hypothetical protein
MLCGDFSLISQTCGVVSLCCRCRVLIWSDQTYWWSQHVSQTYPGPGRMGSSQCGLWVHQYCYGSWWQCHRLGTQPYMWWTGMLFTVIVKTKVYVIIWVGTCDGWKTAEFKRDSCKCKVKRRGQPRFCWMDQVRDDVLWWNYCNESYIYDCTNTIFACLPHTIFPPKLMWKIVVLVLRGDIPPSTLSVDSQLTQECQYLSCIGNHFHACNFRKLDSCSSTVTCICSRVWVAIGEGWVVVWYSNELCKRLPSFTAGITGASSRSRQVCVGHFLLLCSLFH